MLLYHAVVVSGSTMVVGEMAAHVDYSVEYAAGGKVPIKSRVPVGTPLRLTFSLKNESREYQSRQSLTFLQ